MDEEEKRKRTNEYKRAWRNRNPEKQKTAVNNWKARNPGRMAWYENRRVKNPTKRGKTAMELTAAHLSFGA